MLREHIEDTVKVRFPWMDSHLAKIIIKDEYKSSLANINKEDYLNDLAAEMDELM